MNNRLTRFLGAPFSMKKNRSGAIYHRLKQLAARLNGDLYTCEAHRLLYATDASPYREVPLAVVRSRDKEDVRQLIAFAAREGTPLIPRAAGTSLAGQVVGSGIVVDISRYMNRILEVNAAGRWVRVEPGVVLDELNDHLRPYGLFFAPETSTSNRCMIGGMAGNNACGSHSLVYGSTRDHILSLKVLLSDGLEAEFSDLTQDEFNGKCRDDTLEGRIYSHIRDILSDPGHQDEIRREYPDPALRRRNTGYALDMLLDCSPFTPGGPPFNFSRLLAGSEGTLAFIYELKLKLVPLPPKEKLLVCVHFRNLSEAFQANLIALEHHPDAIELMDHLVLEQTTSNPEQQKNRFFIHGEPAAILIVEFSSDSTAELSRLAEGLEEDLRRHGFGYHFPRVSGEDTRKVWALRKAGLGLLTNIPGDAKPVSVIEDTAVTPQVLPAYIEEFRALLGRYSLNCVFYAHIATGELHLRPLLNLKDKKDVELFHTIALETARLVKKYRGSFSGEHGDGRLRGEFIPLLVGEKNYALLQQVKKVWDPQNIFNPGKIVHTPPMTTSLRYVAGEATREVPEIFDYSDTQGFLRAVEQCNGLGDCRKSAQMGGVMCPSYMATTDENKTTRARANTLREYITHSPKKNPFDHQEIFDILDLCLSCKGCKTECPSGVDMTKYKAEFLQHYYDAHHVPLRTLTVARLPDIYRLASRVPGVYNVITGNRVTAFVLKKMMGFAETRSLPQLSDTTLRAWYRCQQPPQDNAKSNAGTVYLLADEFSDTLDAAIGIKTVLLLTQLGYRVIIPPHLDSGRTYLSKGLLRRAQACANGNVELLGEMITGDTPLVGIEPSTLLAFRDEYPVLVRPALREAARHLAAHAMLIDEFIAREIKKGRIVSEQFTAVPRKILLHGHCYQKVLSSTSVTREMLSLPPFYEVEEIRSGCCGMAGAFGYEKKHYELSMKVGELVLFPAVRGAPADVVIAAPGTSCRQQIRDGTGRQAFHPVEILYDALLT